MEFRLIAQCPSNGDIKTFTYDNVRSTLCDGETGEAVAIPEGLSSVLQEPPSGTAHAHPAFSPGQALGKNSGQLRKISITLGFACNFECAYCGSRQSPNTAHSGASKAQAFLEKMPEGFGGGEDGLGKGVCFEFWGGEPFVYWKTLKPLAEGLRQRYPNASLVLVTNGSLLDSEKAYWLEILDFHVVISHDGPGQAFRGKDPLQDSNTRQVIFNLYQRLRSRDRISFNAVLHPGNQSRAAISRFLADFAGDPNVACGIGRLADPDVTSGCGYFRDPSETFSYRRKALEEIRDGVFQNFKGIRARISCFLKSIAYQIPAHSIETSCMWHDASKLAVDLEGNVITCPHIAGNSPSHSGRTHTLGKVERLGDVRVDTFVHWRSRPMCSACPMLHICRGNCPIKTGSDWDAVCETTYTDCVPVFAATIEWLTGYIPFRIEGADLPPGRRNLFGISTENVTTKPLC